MPRYFFDVFDGETLVDPVGVECVDEATAREQAVRAAGDQLRDAPSLDAWSMKIRAESGEVVAHLTFNVLPGHLH